jgi:hypothetical protein
MYAGGKLLSTEYRVPLGGDGMGWDAVGSRGLGLGHVGEGVPPAGCWRFGWVGIKQNSRIGKTRVLRHETKTLNLPCSGLLHMKLRSLDRSGHQAMAEVAASHVR